DGQGIGTSDWYRGADSIAADYDLPSAIPNGNDRLFLDDEDTAGGGAIFRGARRNGSTEGGDYQRGLCETAVARTKPAGTQGEPNDGRSHGETLGDDCRRRR